MAVLVILKVWILSMSLPTWEAGLRNLTVYMGDAIRAQWSMEKWRFSQAEPEKGTHVKGVYWGSTVSGEAVRAAAQGRGRAEQGCGLGWSLASATPIGNAGMWIRTTPELVPLWARGLAFCHTQGWASACLVYGCKLPGQETVIVPRTLLWKRAAMSP